MTVLQCIFPAPFLYPTNKSELQHNVEILFSWSFKDTNLDKALWKLNANIYIAFTTITYYYSINSSNFILQSIRLNSHLSSTHTNTNALVKTNLHFLTWMVVMSILKFIRSLLISFTVYVCVCVFVQ